MSLVDIDPNTASEIKRIIERSPQELMSSLDGLDPSARHWLEQVIREYQRDGYSASLQKLRSRDFIREPVSAEEFLSHKYMGRFIDGLYPVWRKDICHVEESGVYEWILTGSIGCFSGDTRVSLLDGRELSFVELCKEFEGKSFWVYSFDKDTQSVVPGLASNPRVTKRVSSLVKIQLDNEEQIKCTPDHLFMLRDGSYREAKDLKPGDSLMPLYRKISTPQEFPDTTGYRLVKNLKEDNWKFEHKLSDDKIKSVNYMNGQLVYCEKTNKHRVRHHLNFNKLDNTPENLVWMTWREHRSYHRKFCERSLHKRWFDVDLRPGAILKAQDNMRRLNSSSDHQKKCMDGLRRNTNIFKRRSERAKTFNSESHPNLRKYVTSEQVMELRKKGLTRYEIAVTLKCSEYLISLRMDGFQDPLKNTLQSIRWKMVKCPRCNKEMSACALGGHIVKSNCGKNHKVISVEIVESEEDVYDLTVEKYQNFSLSAGVFVHNCGKTRAATLSMAYRLSVVSCLRDPAEFYGHMAGEVTVFGIYNVTLDKASDIYGRLKIIVENAPYFRECYKPISKASLEFSNRVAVKGGSRELHALGDDLLVFIIDEMNFMKGKGDVSQAHKLYNATIRRLESRFTTQGWTPGLVILMSSRNTVTSFLEVHLKSVYNTNKNRKDAGLKPGVLVSDYSLWGVKRDKFSKETFLVLVGDRYTASEVLPLGSNISDFVQEKVAMSAGTITEEELTNRIIEVPMDFYDSFSRDVDGCVTGDTKISLLNGTEVAIKDLVGLSEFWVYSFGSDGRMYPGRGYDVRFTKRSKIVKVTLNNMESVRCTFDHLFMLRDGSYKQAKDLVIGDSLMPLYRGKDRHGYEMFQSNVGGRWVHTHLIVGREFYNMGNRISPGLVLHHKNKFILDNSPINLEIMTQKEHHDLHCENLAMLSLEGKKKAREKRRSLWNRCRSDWDPWQKETATRGSLVLRNYNKSEKHKKSASLVGKRNGESPTQAQRDTLKNNYFTSEEVRERNLINNPSKNPEVKLKKSLKLKGKPFLGGLEAGLKGVHTRFHTRRGIVNPNCKYCVSPTNHNVVSVLPDGEEDVYDLSVENYNNFSITAGVVLHNSIRDIAGRATISVSPLIKDKKSIQDSFDKSRHDIFTKNPISISTVEKSIHIMDFVDKRQIFRIIQSQYQLRFNPNIPRCLHVDLGITGDSAAIAMGHVLKYEQMSNYRLGSDFLNINLPFICFDCLLTINPPLLGEIPIQKLLDFIIALRSFGVIFQIITYDGFQSRHSIQILKNNGFAAETFSVDRDDAPYRFLRAAYSDRRVVSYFNAVLEDELTFLEHDIDERKVDHPEGKTKDLADCVASVIYHCTMAPPVGFSEEQVDRYMQFMHSYETSDYRQIAEAKIGEIENAQPHTV